MPEFRVERTSIHDSQEQSCDEAILKETGEMTNEGSLKEREVWEINIKLLDELINFWEKYGELI